MIPFRALRAIVFATVSVMLGIGAHRVSGGSVSGLAMLAGWGACFLPAWFLAGRERVQGVIMATLAGSQAVLHLLFSVAHTMEPAVPLGHAHAGLVPGLGMLLMHGWAVVLTALWLSRGEAALWGVLRRLAVRLLAVVGVSPVGVRGPDVVPPAERDVVVRTVLLGHEISRRGPPGAVRTAAV